MLKVSYIRKSGCVIPFFLFLAESCWSRLTPIWWFSAQSVFLLWKAFKPETALGRLVHTEKEHKLYVPPFPSSLPPLEVLPNFPTTLSMSFSSFGSLARLSTQSEASLYVLQCLASESFGIIGKLLRFSGHLFQVLCLHCLFVYDNNYVRFLNKFVFPEDLFSIFIIYFLYFLYFNLFQIAGISQVGKLQMS